MKKILNRIAWDRVATVLVCNALILGIIGEIIGDGFIKGLLWGITSTIIVLLLVIFYEIMDEQ
jgi:hypothetical protein